MTTSYCRHSPFLSREGNIWHAFLRANIQELTFHQTNYCGRLQTIRWFRQSDWKSVGLPFRLKELRTFSCFFYSNIEDSTFPHQPKAGSPPFSPERETCCILPVNQLSHAYFLTKWKKCNIVSLFLQIHIVESTIHHSLMRTVHPFFQERSCILHFPFWRNFSILSFYKRAFRFPL